MIQNQATLFLLFVLNGVIIGLIFDFFRILRRSFKSKDIVTYIEDILFWIITGISILYFVFVFNNGEIRLYMFIAILIGIITYMITISKYIIKVNVYILNFLKSILGKILEILLIPFKMILQIFKKIFFKPICFGFINIRKISTNFNKKFFSNLKNSKKVVKN